MKDFNTGLGLTGCIIMAGSIPMIPCVRGDATNLRRRRGRGTSAFAAG
jgi:hypothetical protein